MGSQGSDDEMSEDGIKTSERARSAGGKQRKCDLSSEWVERREEQRATGTILILGPGGETDGPMGGRDGGQEPIRGRQGDLPTPGLAMIENHDPPLGKEQLDIRSQESRQNSARIEI